MNDDALSAVLADWHEWSSGYQHTRGFPSRAAGCGDWRASRQWDDWNNAIDADNHHAQMQIVDFEVRQLVEPLRTAIYINARAISTGTTVFQSPRLPADQTATLRLIQDARQELGRRLVGRGVLEAV